MFDKGQKQSSTLPCDSSYYKVSAYTKLLLFFFFFASYFAYLFHVKTFVSCKNKMAA